jgi:hypothetical protein
LGAWKWVFFASYRRCELVYTFVLFLDVAAGEYGKGLIEADTQLDYNLQRRLSLEENLRYIFGIQGNKINKRVRPEYWSHRDEWGCQPSLGSSS